MTKHHHNFPLTISEIFERAGGVRAVSEASKCSTFPVGENAVHKWRYGGIPERHWEWLMPLAGVTVEELYQANRLTLRDVA